MLYFMGIDNGGTNTKAAVFDQNGNEIAASSQNTPLLVPREGFNERDMQELWKATATAIRGAIEKSGVCSSEIVGVGCTGHGKGLYLWGKDDRPAYHAVASTDRRGVEYVEKWYADGTARQAEALSLQPVGESQPVAILAWIKEHRPEVFQNIRWIFEAKDFIRFMLTGKAMAEVTDYSGTGFMNLHTKSYDRALLELFGLNAIFEALPPLCQSYDLCGTVTEAAARDTGLSVGTPVCGGMFDIDACAIAMDISTPNRLCMITGTWSINEYISKTPVYPALTTRNSLFCIPGYYLIEQSSPTSSGNLEWFINNFIPEAVNSDIDKKQLYRQIDGEVDALLPQDSNILFLPFLYGTYDEKCASSAFVGMTNYHTRGHMLRAIFEGVCFSHLHHIEALLQHRTTPEAIRMTGGAANSSVWVQMFADIIGMPIEVVKTKEPGALGCAMAAAVAAGVYSDYESAAENMVRVSATFVPRKENADIYRKKYERYCRLITLLGQQ